MATKTKKYTKLKPRKLAGGLFAIKAKAGTKLGNRCLICNKALVYKFGRPPIICRKQECYRAMRTAYRKDYEAARA